MEFYCNNKHEMIPILLIHKGQGWMHDSITCQRDLLNSIRRHYKFHWNFFSCDQADPRILSSVHLSVCLTRLFQWGLFSTRPAKFSLALPSGQALVSQPGYEIPQISLVKELFLKKIVHAMIAPKCNLIIQLRLLYPTHDMIFTGNCILNVNC